LVTACNGGSSPGYHSYAVATAEGATVDILNELDIPQDLDVTLREARDVFGSPFRVTDIAQRSAVAFVAAVAHLEQVRTGRRVPATVDGLHAAVSFHSERLLSAERLEKDLWAPLSGNYRAADGWLRIHANLGPHAEAARRVLGIEGDDASAAISQWKADELVASIREEGGVAAEMRTLDQWRQDPHREHLWTQPLVGRTAGNECPKETPSGPLLQGMRIVDCTRVIAGPVAGRLLTSFGATVTKIDAPLDDSPTLELDTGWGKVRTHVDLRTHAGRVRFEQLIGEADVLLEGFRPGALDGLGYDDNSLRRLRPQLIIGHLSAFGQNGPLGGLRGFDSVVQVTNGIAHRCGYDDETGPSSLPAQALDHGAGHLLAAGVVRALTERHATASAGSVEVSLARTGEWLVSLGDGTHEPARDISALAAPFLRRFEDPTYGMVEHVAPVGRVGAADATWPRRALPPRPTQASSK
jgi:hypothetical protein